MSVVGDGGALRVAMIARSAVLPLYLRLSSSFVLVIYLISLRVAPLLAPSAVQ